MNNPIQNHQEKQKYDLPKEKMFVYGLGKTLPENHECVLEMPFWVTAESDISMDEALNNLMNNTRTLQVLNGIVNVEMSHVVIKGETIYRIMGKAALILVKDDKGPYTKDHIDDVYKKLVFGVKDAIMQEYKKPKIDPLWYAWIPITVIAGYPMWDRLNGGLFMEEYFFKIVAMGIPAALYFTVIFLGKVFLDEKVPHISDEKPDLTDIKQRF